LNGHLCDYLIQSVYLLINTKTNALGFDISVKIRAVFVISTFRCFWEQHDRSRNPGMEREDVGGGRYARPPVRNERLPDDHNPISMRQDYVGVGSRPDDRYSGRYDAPAEQQHPRFGYGDHPRSRSRSRSPVRGRPPHRVSGGDGAYPRRTPRFERGDRVDRPAMVFDAPPNATLIIKNLPPVADEDMVSGPWAACVY